MASFLEDGDDFSNNLASDVAPLLSLFGEQVTKQFMSQSTGWADCIMLAMAPIGIVTIIVSAIRVGGYPWLKAVVGRARENIAAAEIEFMSSTSKEACELSNGKSVVRCLGTADICEFVCIYPTGATDSPYITSVRIMDIEEATWPRGSYLRIRDKKRIRTLLLDVVNLMMYLALVCRDRIRSSVSKTIQHLPLSRLKKMVQPREDGSIEDMESGNSVDNSPKHGTALQNDAEPHDSLQPEGNPSFRRLEEREMIIVRNRKHFAPNISLNCQADGRRWLLWVYATCGVIIQGGVLVYFGFVAEYDTLKFDKKGQPVEDYAMPLAITGTLLLVSGMLMCGHIVDSGSEEEVREVVSVDENPCTMALVWLQKQKTVSDQHFKSAAIYLETNLSRVATSKRLVGEIEEGEEDQSDQAETKKGILEPRAGTTASRNEESKHKSHGRRLQILTTAGVLISLLGFGGQFTGLRGMHWTASIAHLGAVVLMTFLRAVVRRHLNQEIKHKNLHPGFEMDWFVMSLPTPNTAQWLPKKPDSKRFWQRLSSNSPPRTEFSNTFENSMTNQHTRRFWTIRTGVVPEKACNQKSQNAPNNNHYQVRDLTTAQSILDLRRYLGELGNSKGPAFTEALALANAIEATMSLFESHLEEPHNNCFTWTLTVKDTNLEGGTTETISLNVRKTENGWEACVDELDSALSLWLYSVNGTQDDRDAMGFPSGNDRWIRGKKTQERCLQVIGPSADRLVQELEWWMPNGLEGIMTACGPDQQREACHHVQSERVGRSGQRWPNFTESEMTHSDAQHDAPERVTTWYWKPTESVSVRKGDNGELSQTSPLFYVFQDSLERLYAKDMFSSFLWSLAERLRPSSVSQTFTATVQPHNSADREHWMEFTLKSYEFSRLAQGIAELGLWTEREVYLSLIPSMSASDNLPGQDAVIELFFINAASAEKSRNWYDASVAYHRLHSISCSFPSRSYIRWKSVAALLRFDARLRGCSPNLPGYWAMESQRKVNDQMINMPRAADFVAIQEKLDAVFDVYKILNKYAAQLVDSGIDMIALDPAKAGNIHPSSKPRDEHQDIFNRTRLHHAASGIIFFTSRQFGPRFKQFREYSDRAAIEIENICKDDPINWSPELSSALVTGFSGFRDLLSDGVDPSAQDLDHWTPLHYACYTVSRQQQAWDDPRPFLTAQRHDGNNEISLANFWRNLAVAKAHCLIRAKANVEARGLDGLTPLHCAVLSSNSELVELLVQNKANVTTGDIQGRTPLHLAAMNNLPEMCSLLLKSGSNIDDQDLGGLSPLHLAAISEATDSMDQLIALGASVGARDNEGKTPLHVAAMHSSCKAIKALLPTSITDRNDGTRGAAANLNVKEKYGLVALHLAVEKNNIEAVRVIIGYTAQYWRSSWPPKDKDGWTPLHFAAIFGHVDMIKEISSLVNEHNLDAEVILAESASERETAFNMSVRMGDLPVVRAFLDIGFDEGPLSGDKLKRRLLEDRDHQGRTALDIATEEGLREMELELSEQIDRL